MRLVIAATLLLGLFVPVAHADTPAGVHEEVALEAPASWVAGKPVRVYCADDPGAWDKVIASVGVVGDAAGFALIDHGEAYLAAGVCPQLVDWDLWSGANFYGAAALVLVHEAVHLSGMLNESETDCRALSLLPTVLERFFVTRQQFEVFTGAVVASITAEAWQSHRNAPPQYTQDC